MTFLQKKIKWKRQRSVELPKYQWVRNKSSSNKTRKWSQELHFSWYETKLPEPSKLPFLSIPNPSNQQLFFLFTVNFSFTTLSFCSLYLINKQQLSAEKPTKGLNFLLFFFSRFIARVVLLNYNVHSKMKVFFF